jgi:hypothetical protein
MGELEIPFEHGDLVHPELDAKVSFYTLRVCKACRADWLKAIKAWYDRPAKRRESPGSGIYVRDFGDTIEVTAEEFEEMRKSREDKI